MSSESTTREHLQFIQAIDVVMGGIILLLCCGMGGVILLLCCCMGGVVLLYGRRCLVIMMVISCRGLNIGAQGIAPTQQPTATTASTSSYF